MDNEQVRALIEKYEYVAVKCVHGIDGKYFGVTKRLPEAIFEIKISEKNYDIGEKSTIFSIFQRYDNSKYQIADKIKEGFTYICKVKNIGTKYFTAAAVMEKITPERFIEISADQQEEVEFAEREYKLDKVMALLFSKEYAIQFHATYCALFVKTASGHWYIKQKGNKVELYHENTAFLGGSSGKTISTAYHKQYLNGDTANDCLSYIVQHDIGYKRVTVYRNERRHLYEKMERVI